MNKPTKWLVVVAAFASVLLVGKSPRAYAAKNANDPKSGEQLALPLDSMDGLEVRGISDEGAEAVKFEANVANYRGRRAVRIVNIEGPRAQTGEQVLGIVKTSDFKDGTIEAAVAGVPRQGAQPGTRGFIGIAFRIQDNGSRFEAFYLRMTNGRANDQLQRNHSVQYVSHPGFTWRRLREENPGVYESYVDLDAGAWTRVKIVVAGTKAQLYVNGADQPCLIVNDLKLGESHGQIALWAGSDTEAYFADLKVK
jgi:hypothetical protein